MYRPKFSKPIRVIIFLLIFFLIMVFLKVYINSRREFLIGEGRFLNKDYESAIVHYQRSIHWYIPLSGYVKISAERLWEIGNIAEEKQNYQIAIKAYRTLRSSFYATRSFYTPYREWIDRTNQKIASLIAETQSDSSRKDDMTFEERKSEALNLLSKKMRPDPFWSFMVEIGLIGWIACTIILIFSLFKNHDRIVKRKALFLTGLTILFYALWIIGLLKA
ncbi:MAG: tol-pal system YbgF family protein [Nitrospirota bacterium]